MKPKKINNSRIKSDKLAHNKECNIHSRTAKPLSESQVNQYPKQEVTYENAKEYLTLLLKLIKEE